MKNREKIKIKKDVKGFDSESSRLIKDIYVQITQDKRGTTISLENYSISLTELGYKLVRDIWD